MYGFSWPIRTVTESGVVASPSNFSNTTCSSNASSTGFTVVSNSASYRVRFGIPPTTTRLDASLVNISSKVAIAAWPMKLWDGGNDSKTLPSRTPACDAEFPTAAAFRCARSSASVWSSCSGSSSCRCSIRPVEVIKISRTRWVDSDTISTCRTVA